MARHGQPKEVANKAVLQQRYAVTWGFVTLLGILQGAASLRKSHLLAKGRNAATLMLHSQLLTQNSGTESAKFGAG
jgi:hypothetical protein